MAAAAPPVWATTIMVDNRDQPCVEAQWFPLVSTIYCGLSFFRPLRKLLALSYLYHLDEEMHSQGWLAEEQAGFCLGYYVEDHQLLLTYLLLVASH